MFEEININCKEMIMEKEFIPYEQALALEELGFDEDCFSDYFSFNNVNQTLEDDIQLILNQESIDDYCEENNLYPFHICSAPLYQQAFRWFREKYGYDVSIKKCTPSEYKFEIEQLFVEGDNYYFIDFSFLSHEEAELKCLKKLIKIVKQK